MRIAKRISIGVTVLLLLSQVAVSQVDYDAVRDFSIASNPNGVWSYGYLTELRTPLILYTSSDDLCLPGMSFWGLLVGPCTLIPAVAHNDTSQIYCWLTNCVPPDYLFIQGGYNGELSVVRWTAPAPGEWKVSGAVMGIDCAYPTSSGFHLILNTNHTLLSAPIDSCNAPLTFENRLRMTTGSTLEFVVDWGRDQSTIGDGTGIQFKVRRVPNPLP